MVTQKDIAKEAGVSSVTVSNVVNGNFHKVSEENIKRIQDLIEKYGYTPNAAARSLAKKGSQIIGVVIPNVGVEDNFLDSPYNAKVLGVLEKIIRAQNYYMMVQCVRNCKQVIPLLDTWNVSGVIFYGTSKEDAEDIVKQVKIPVVFLDTYLEGLATATVRVDDYKGGYLATRYLISMGHKDILFAGPKIYGETVMPRRYQGYEAAMKEYGLDSFIRWQSTPYTNYDCGIESGKKIAFLDRVPTAVFAAADIIALGIIAGLKLSGKVVPGDVSVVGFDNLAEGRYSNPQLTTVSQNTTKKAETAAHHLFEMIKLKEKRCVNETVDVEIIERQSVKRI